MSSFADIVHPIRRSTQREEDMSEREFYVRKLVEMLNTATLEEIKTLYTAALAYIKG